MIIPLPLDAYIAVSVGDLTSPGWIASRQYNRTFPMTVHDRNLVGYRLSRASEAICAESPSNLVSSYCLDYVVGKGVCLITPDHRYGRGLIPPLLGWKWLFSVYDSGADDVEQEFAAQTRSPYIRSQFIPSNGSAIMAIFNVADEEAVLWAQLRFENCSARTTNRPLGDSDQIRNSGAKCSTAKAS